MLLDWVKKVFGRRSETSMTRPKTINMARDIRSGATALESKVRQLNKFKQACDEAGLTQDFENAAVSARAFAAKSLGYLTAGDNLDEARENVLANYEKVTLNLATLAVAANSAGINLQAEARAVFDVTNDLMAKMGLARE
jgi:hypothetical protein